MPDSLKSSPRAFGYRISILTPTLAGGGAERAALSLASGLVERGHEVDLLLQRLVCHYSEDVLARTRLFYMARRGDAATRAILQQGAVTFRPLVSSPLPWRIRFARVGAATKLHANQLPLLASTRLPRWAAGIAAYVDREQPDALLAVNGLAAAAAAMAVCLAHRPVRLVAAQHDVFRSGRLRHRARRSYPYADAVVGVSQGVVAELARIPSLTHDRIYTVYNPVVFPDLDRKGLELAGHPWIDNPLCPVVLAIGRLKKVKDFPTLLTAFARLVAQRPVRLIVLGQGRLRPSLLSMAQRIGIAEHVDFPGFVENPYAFLSKADLFVLSSRYESLSNVLIEALACGCPVVSTDCPYGPREILEGGRLGPLVPVGDSEALAVAMARVLDEPPQRAGLRERASFFSTERAVDRYEELLLGEEISVASELLR